MAQLGVSATFTSVGPQGTPDIAYSNGFFVIQSPWGVPNVPTACVSQSDFERNFGGLNHLNSVASALTADTFTVVQTDSVVQGYYAVSGFFKEKGSQSPGVAWVTRVVQSGSPPTAASKTFVAGPASGGFNTSVVAKWLGLHGGTVQAYWINPSPQRGVFAVQAGTVAVTSGMAVVTGTGTSFQTGSTWVGWGIKIGTNYYTILSVASPTSLTLDENASATETTAAFSVGNNTTAARLYLYHPASNRREEWDLEPNVASAANITRKSELVSVTLPVGLQLPKTTAPGAAGATKLQSGSAATADAYGASDADLQGATSAAGVKTGLQAFNDLRYGGGGIAIPGKVSTTIRSALTTHASSFFRWIPLGSSSGLNLTTAQTEFSVSHNYAAGYVPRIEVADANSPSGGSLIVDPCGHILGLAARMDGLKRGPHKSPAGVKSEYVFNSVLDVEANSDGTEKFDDAGSNLLADVRVNTIRRKHGAIAVYGLRTFSTDARYSQVNFARVISLVYHTGILILEKYFTEVLDPYGRLFSDIEGDLGAAAEDFWRRGMFFGNKPGDSPDPDDAYRVICNRSNNPNVNLSKGEIHAGWSFVPAPNAESIYLDIYPAAVGFGAAAATQGV